MTKYQVHYEAGDGTIHSFTFKSDRRMSSYSMCGGGVANGIGRPFLDDMCNAARNIEAREDSAMHKHGGFMWTKIRRIKNCETGQMRHFLG